jgi:sulfofructose kinase
MFDILGLGCCTVDDLLYVEEFPRADAKTRVVRRERQGGGLTATALVAASRLGAKCAYGAQLGRCEYSHYVAENFRRENVDLSHVVWNEAAQPIHSTIIVDTTHHTRNIFFQIGGAVGAHDELPSEETIRQTRVLFLDHYGTTGGIRVAKIAKTYNIPVVADFERDNVPRFYELLPLVNHLVVSEKFALHLSSTHNAHAACEKLIENRDAVVVMCGESGAWFCSRENQTPRHFPAFKVETIDSTGCGDVFHGAYAASLAWGWKLEKRVRFASAAAAIKATRFGAQAGAPRREEVEALINAQG